MSKRFVPANDAVSSQPAIAASIRPSDRQLELINQHVPQGMEPLTADEVIVLSFVAANNLVTRNIGTWTEPDLYKMADMLPGLPATLDHDWGDVGKVVGRVLEAEVQKSATAPKEVLDRAGYFAWNKKIVDRDGLVQTVCNIYFELNSSVIQGLRFGRLREVSVGGFNFTMLGCPHCKTSFADEKCPHLIPNPWMDLNDPEVRKLTAPYYERIGLIDLLEISLVATPAAPNAGVITGSRI
ncbi:hypothetical protein IQ268_08560 [Oculatella sp. LEGE 06141]|uniref:hypothetical protein n=1 Tax=Oculatella sp. LEGE 06141 TaxID=1828648 RepID=UPI0018811274|nr:hypothetical protein [Oculatella sp. LEGE 06141]MBE9178609.1 hypothetical protein [Oculatella sp. LEGE 06141]